MATSNVRVSGAGRQLLGQADPDIRVTQVGRQLVGSASPGIRVTQIGRQILHTPEKPERPSILNITNAYQTQVTLNSSDFAHYGGDSHAATRYQVQMPGGGWTALVYDTGALGAVTSGVVYGLSASTLYEARVAYQDDDGDWSDWSYAYQFESGYEDLGQDEFDWNDWGLFWNIARARYVDSYIGLGGWHGPVDWSGFASGEDPAHPDAGEWISAGINGNVGSYGRLMGPPAILGNTAFGPNTAVNVAAIVTWHSAQGGFSWERWWDCEYGRAGVAALACGTVEPTDPSYGWDLWNPYPLGIWQATSDMQGIVAYIEPQSSFPYQACVCGQSGSIVDVYNPVLNCYHYGLSPAKLIVDVYFAGALVQRYGYDLPWWTVFNQLTPIYRDGAWHCRFFPKYGVRLKVWKDLVTDPTGKTHRIQAAASSPATTYHEGVDWGTQLQMSGYWGIGVAPLPGEDGPWMIDETWIGGNEESTPGAGDGGLYCGYAGYCSQRWTGATFPKTTGATFFSGFVVTDVDQSQCGDPCTPYTPEPEPEPEPEVYALEAFPALQPCPPDVDTADKELYLGGHGSDGAIFQFGGYEVEEGRQLIARIRPNPISPMGVGGECLFRSIYVVVEHMSDLSISLTPILNGERLDAYAHQTVLIGPGDRMRLERYEVPLYRAYEDAVVEGAASDRFKYGLRGTFLTFEMRIVDLCGIGLTLPGVWVEYDPVRESHNTGVVYTEDLRVTPAFIPSGQVFMGTKGYNRLLKAASGVLDDDAVVQARAFSNPVAPEGEHGECEFRQISLSVKRWNANDMTLNVTPYVDGDPIAPIQISYKATTAPVREVTEVDLASYYERAGGDSIERFRYRRRGAWIHFKVETGSGLQEWLTLEGADVEYDVVREGLQTDVR